MSETNIEDMEFKDLVSINTTSVRTCHYPTCTNELPADSTFDLCDKCRCFAARNAIVLCIDPTAPAELQRMGSVVATLLTNLTGDEILRTCERIEFVYLEFQKVIKRHNLENSSSKGIRVRVGSSDDPLDDPDIVSKSKKSSKTKRTRSEKLQDLLGVDAKKAAEIMGEEYDL